jgi:hypothetical protein
MNFVKKLLMTVGIAALVASLGSLLAPKAAHALVATLVQITNTIDNPVPTTEALGTVTPLSASCKVNFTDPAEQVTAPCFTVPSGMRAVIEQVDGQCFVPPEATASNLILHVGNFIGAGVNIIHPLRLDPAQDPNRLLPTFSVPLRDYVDSGVPLHVHGSVVGDPFRDTSCAATITGRLYPMH